MLVVDYLKSVAGNTALLKAQAIEDPVKLAQYVFNTHIKPKIDNPRKEFGNDVKGAQAFFGDLANRFSFGSADEWQSSSTMAELDGKVTSMREGIGEDGFDYGRMVRGIATGITLKDRAREWNPVLSTPDFLEDEVESRGGLGGMFSEDYDRSVKAVETTDDLSNAIQRGAPDKEVAEYGKRVTGGKTSPSGRPLQASKPKQKKQAQPSAPPTEVPQRMTAPAPRKFISRRRRTEETAKPAPKRTLESTRSKPKPAPQPKPRVGKQPAPRKFMSRRRRANS